MTLKRVTMSHLQERSASFCNPKTGEMIHKDGARITLKVDKKTGLTPLAAFLDTCTSVRLFIVGRLTDTTREWYSVERYSKWLGDGIFAERSYMMKKDNRNIELRATCKSFFPSCTDVSEAYTAYQALSELYKKHTNMPLLSSPSSTGLTLLETTLPRDMVLEPLEEQYERVIREFTTQSRQEVLTPFNLDTIEDFYYLDGRWMYAACLDYEMPIGAPIHDSIPVYQKYVTGWYRVTATVPATWEHIGLIPQPIGKGKDKVWKWNSTPNATITTWISEPELRVAVENGWSIKVLERLLFPKAKPFRTWRKELVTMREEASTIQDETIRKHVQAGIRQIMLTAIGRLYSMSWKREQKIPIDDYVKQLSTLPISSRLNAIRSGDVMIIPVTDALTSKDKRYYHPYLASYIWSYCRMLLTKAMLQVPRETILGCRLDAIYTTANPMLEDTGKIGQFRLKGALHKTMKAPLTLDDLHTLSELSEIPKEV